MGQAERRRPLKEYDGPFNKVGLVLAVMAVVSTVSLDLMNHARGERSFLFGRKGAPVKAAVQKAVPPPAAAAVPSLEKLVAEALSAAGRPSGSFYSSTARDGTVRFTVLVKEGEEKLLLDRLEEILTGKALKLKAGKKAGPALVVTRGKGEKAEIVMSIRREAAPQKAPVATEKPTPPEPPAPAPAESVKPAAVKEVPPAGRERPQVALIVDDLGEDMGVLSAFLDLGLPLTIAILPESAHAAEAASMASEKGLEVLLHLPMEAMNGTGPNHGSNGFITTAMSEEEILDRFRADLARVPHAVGINNHMGSRFTSDAGLMRSLLTAVKAEGLFFVDSRTIAGSKGFSEARKMGLRAAERDVFLDADDDRSLIGDRLVELLRKARKHGSAVGICHPFPETIEALKSAAALLDEFGLEAVPVSRLVR